MQHVWARMALTVEEAVKAINERFGITLECWRTNNFWSINLNKYGLAYQRASDKSLRLNITRQGNLVISFSVVSDDNSTRTFKLHSREDFDENVLSVLQKTTGDRMGTVGAAMLERIVGLL